MSCFGMGRSSTKVAIVTGCSYGIGRGIALVLARDEGYTVYATGRTLEKLQELAGEVTAGPGKIVAVKLDQKDDKAVEAFVATVERSEGKVDLLVNNAYGGFPAMKPHFGKTFWQKPVSVYDASQEVGTRSAYVMSTFVAPMMVAAGSGMIVQLSSGGGGMYLFDVGYGVGKAGLDRLSWDMATELKPTGVRAMTLWPGGCTTDRIAFGGDPGESPIFVGRAVAAIMKASEADKTKMNGKMVQTTELATKYGFLDENGKMPAGDYCGVAAQTGIRGMMSGPVAWYNNDGELGNYQETNNEGISGVWHGF